MGKVIVNLTVSLDGFIAGPDDRPGQPLDVADVAARGVALVGAQLDLLAAVGRLAVDQPHVEDRLAVAVLAGDLDLFDRVGQLHDVQRGRPR